MAAEDHQIVDVNQTFFTLIPSRFPTIDVFARVANDRSGELAELESLTNPRLRERDRLLSGAQVVDGNGPLLQNWNHAPFTYHNPEGSRFFEAGSRPRASRASRRASFWATCVSSSSRSSSRPTRRRSSRAFSTRRR